MWARFAIGYDLRAVVTAAMIAVTAALASVAQAATPGPALASLESLRLSLDQIATALQRRNLSVDDVVDLRQRLLALRDDIATKVSELSPRLVQASAQLNQLGSPPAKDSPPEDPALAAQREQLTRLHGELDAASKQMRLMDLRIGELLDLVNERRRAIFTRELLERSSSILDPSFWIEAAGALPGEARSLGLLLRSWWGFAEEQGGSGRLTAAALTVVAFAVAAMAFGRWWRRRTGVRSQGPERFF